MMDPKKRIRAANIQSRIDGEYYFYKDGRLMDKTENFEEIKSIIVQILR